MTIDWNDTPFIYLKNKLLTGQVILFAGAGFSLGSKNQFNEVPPLGGKLAELLAKEAGEAYGGESLPTVWEAVQPIIGTNRLWAFLQEHYTVKSAAEWYSLAGSVSWFRIYTTNIDNLFQFIAPYNSGQKIKQIIKGQPLEERDPFFERVQCIHLHGHIDHRTNGLTFSPSDYAKHTARIDPWYQGLVADLHDHPVVYIGTQLDEPAFNHYLELREARPADGGREWRAKSFLVSPTIGSIKAKSLATRNIIAIEATAEEFFASLSTAVNVADLKVPKVRAAMFPHMFGEGHKVGEAIARNFDQIVPGELPRVRLDLPSRFFMGAEANWDDIANHRDADREIGSTLMDLFKVPSDQLQVVVLHGPAGSGKTTTMMRLAHDLAAEGKQVFYARSSRRIDWDGILDLVDSRTDPTERIFVVVDGISGHMGTIGVIENRILESKALTLIVSDRTRNYASKCQRLSHFSPNVISMPDLSEKDVAAVLDRLDKFGFLGVLKNKTHGDQMAAFMGRAGQQLLVAMKEATSGKDFDLILKDEFGELPHEAQLAYTICSIAVAQGAPGVLRKHLLPCIPKSTFAKGVVVEDLLRGVLIPANESGTMVKPRHRLIAHWVATEVAPVDMRYQAVVKFLMQVAPSIVPNEIKSRSAPYLAYRGMVHSDGLFDILGSQKDVLQLYEDVRECFKNDFLFWLQFGMAHIRAGNLDVAENYLNQSLNINNRSFQTLHHLGVLYLLQAQSSENPAAMVAKADEGMDILREQMLHRSDDDSYAYHAYLTHVSRWYDIAGDVITLEEWEALRKVGNEARAKYRLDDRILEAANELETLYLRRGIRYPDA
jgi:tetratricopeptide (TPR) repeat protein/GTPase SAR1 family protein